MLRILSAMAVMSVLLVTATFFLDRREPAVAASETTDTETETIAFAEEVIPEYLAFVPTLEAGGVYTVRNSSETEFLEEDEDNKLEELDQEELEEDRLKAIEDQLDVYGLTTEDVELPREEKFDIGEAKRLGSIKPGIYVTPIDATDCEYHLYRTMEDGVERLIGSDSITEGRLMVQINGIEPDRFYSSAGCKEWSEWSALRTPLTAVDNGDYWVGDLAQGTWRVGRDCIWERVGDFRGARIFDVLESGNGSGELSIDDSTAGLRVRGCSQPMVLVADAIPDELAFVDEEFEPIETRRRFR